MEYSIAMGEQQSQLELLDNSMEQSQIFQVLSLLQLESVFRLLLLGSLLAPLLEFVREFYYLLKNYVKL